MHLMSVRQVGDELGVSRQRVMQLIDSAALPAEKVGGSWVIRAEDVAAVRGRNAPGRPISPESAWAMVMMSYLPSNEHRRTEVSPSPVVRARTRMRLKELVDAVQAGEPDRLAAQLRRLLGRRAERCTYRVSTGDLADLRDDGRLVLSGLNDVASGLVDASVVEAYVASDDLAGVVRNYLLDEASEAQSNVVLHVPGEGAPEAWKLWCAAPIVQAADLVEHQGARASREAWKGLRDALLQANPSHADLKHLERR